jgi:hypothetical protein
VSALLHYAWLKGMRDRSVLVFFLIAPIQIAAIIIGISVSNHHIRYPLLPLALDEGDVAVLSVILPYFVAACSAFWTFRSEVATKAIGSFVIGSRPLTVVLALVVFAAATAICGQAALFGVAVALTKTFPASLGSAAFTAAIASVAGASLGALYVTISPQPAMLPWAFLAGIPLTVFIINPASRPHQVPIASLLSIGCVAISTVLLRRRCAA